jgi:hypothetical protein
LPGLPRRGDRIFEWFSRQGSGDRVATRNSSRSHIEPLTSSASFRLNRFQHGDLIARPTDPIENHRGAALPAEAEMFGPGFQPCGEKNLHTRCRRVRAGKNQCRGSAVECSLQGASSSDRRRSTTTAAGSATPVGPIPRRQLLLPPEYRAGRSDRCKQPNAYVR